MEVFDSDYRNKHNQKYHSKMLKLNKAIKYETVNCFANPFEAASKCPGSSSSNTKFISETSSIAIAEHQTPSDDSCKLAGPLITEQLEPLKLKPQLEDHTRITVEPATTTNTNTLQVKMAKSSRSTKTQEHCDFTSIASSQISSLSTTAIAENQKPPCDISQLTEQVLTKESKLVEPVPILKDHMEIAVELATHTNTNTLEVSSSTSSPILDTSPQLKNSQEPNDYNSVKSPQISNFEHPTYFDIAQFIERSEISDTEKYNILQNHYRPDTDTDLAYHEVRKGSRNCKVSFQVSWLDDYNWLVYSPSKMGGFCKYCVLFAPSKHSQLNVLVKAPFLRFKSAKGKDGILDHHGKNKYHEEAKYRAMEFINTYNTPETRIDIKMTKEAKQISETNMHTLKQIKILYFFST